MDTKSNFTCFSHVTKDLLICLPTTLKREDHSSSADWRICLRHRERSCPVHSIPCHQLGALCLAHFSKALRNVSRADCRIMSTSETEAGLCRHDARCMSPDNPSKQQLAPQRSQGLRICNQKTWVQIRTPWNDCQVTSRWSQP